METIKNYLETMFMNLPNTAEVRRAKDELFQMMEDKYAELMQEGKTENEAVGAIISEFGNLSELADVLGIDNVVNHRNESAPKQETANAADGSYNQIPPRMISMEEAKSYLRDKATQSFMIAFGVLLCIVAVTGPIMSEAIVGFPRPLGVLLMFGSIAVAVALFVFSGIQISKWDVFKNTRCAIDFATYNEVKSEKDRYRNIYALMTSIGILLCTVCFVPAAVLGEMNPKFIGISVDDLSGAFLFWFVGIGVFLIVSSSIKNSAYKTLLEINDTATMGGNYKPMKKEQTYKSPVVEGIMSVYWPTVTCVYLIWSFLTYDWHITWIIWPIAPIVHTLLDTIFGED